MWVDPIKAVEEVAPTTLEGVNARVTELAAVQEQDTQDIYAVIEDGQDRQTQLFQRVDGLVEDGQFHYETARLLDREAHVSREAWAHSVGLSSAVHYELQAYRTHTQMQDYRIASQESLMTTLIAQVSSLQGQLSAALGQIQALQARDQTHADDPEGAEPLPNVPVVMKPVQSMSSSVTPVRRYGNHASGYESNMLAFHSELPNSTQQNVPKPLGKCGPPDPTVVQSHSETVHPRPIHQLSEITESVCPDHPRSQHKYPECLAPALQQARHL
ncbi:hypothetical protein Tco_0953530 [Tanacetum coccineum]|uniref:Uncharacterized protein n=1 Tax=Tanacetum coccineum TaxID=301880 RepID=A0ABQ5E0A4_9ASTR